VRRVLMRARLATVLSLVTYRQRRDQQTARYEHAKKIAAKVLRQLESEPDEAVLDGLAIALGAALADLPGLEDDYVAILRAAAADLRGKL
jgi:hypothetical protein